MRGTNWVGDVVMSLPFYQGLKEAWPDTELHVLTREHLEPLYRHNPHIAGTVIMEDVPRRRGWRRSLKRVRALECSRAICLPHSFSAALFFALSRIPRRYGRACHHRTPLLTHPLYGTIEDYDGHQADFYLEMLQAISGHVAAGLQPELHFSGREDEVATGLLAGIESPLLGLFASAAYGPAKLWPKESFVELADTWIRATGGSIVLFGGPGDAAINGTIAHAIGARAHDLAGRTGLLETAACMQRCAAVVANDSGPMHLAAASGARTIGIFGSTDPVRTAPRGPQASYITKNLDCAPCMQRTCRHGSYACLQAISPDEVLREIMR